MRNICKCFTITLPSGKKVTAEVESTWLYDSNYGADADGNRGYPVNHLEELNVDQPIEDDNGEWLNALERFQAEKMLLDKAYDDDWDEIGESDECEF